MRAIEQRIRQLEEKAGVCEGVVILPPSWSPFLVVFPGDGYMEMKEQYEKKTSRLWSDEEFKRLLPTIGKLLVKYGQKVIMDRSSACGKLW